MDKKEYLKEIERVIANGRFKDTWESLSQYRVPDWYKDSKLGIFIHWGVYSVPAFGSEWYSRNMYIKGSKEYEHHLKTYGNHKDFGYKDFIPMFRAEKFNADEWLDLFESSGAEYMVPVAEHHDGFQMYRSDISDWNAFEMGPHRDIIGELKAAADRRGIAGGVSSHRVEHWFFMGHGKDFESDITDDEKPGDFYYPAMPEPDHFDLFSEPEPDRVFMEDWLVRCCELVDRFRPKIVYFDWWIQHTAVKPYLKKFAAYYYNRADEWGEGVVINYKHDAFAFGTAVPDVERGQFADAKPFIWQTDTAVARNSWCYTEGNSYKSVREILCDFVDIVSKNGRLLLNIGPESDGTIPDEDKHILTEIGKWLNTNGEAIKGAKAWRKFGEGPTEIKEGQFTDGEAKKFTCEDIRFTANHGNIYAAVMKYPEDGNVTIKTFRSTDIRSNTVFQGAVKKVSSLCSDKEVDWTQDEKGLHIKNYVVDTEYPVVFRIEVI